MSKSSRLRKRRKNKGMFFVVSENKPSIVLSYLRKDGTWWNVITFDTVRFRRKRVAEDALAAAVMRDPSLIGRAWITKS